jgi:hypothetical protein
MPVPNIYSSITFPCQVDCRKVLQRVPNQVCQQVPSKKCRPTTREVPIQVPVQQCKKVPNQSCK